ncbi:unnamed protein product [Fusarium venenatum]|uniref:Uncharacterized protein n=1 Tax=Fusarium venenatum TaxID=56646 RepID=A0A2L2TWS0_9HYPO|nr:uncharacterized protein FVRRES_10524 [Fusarium venenatum]CEI70447.1 unnamed protein product [Fusarium venenatum]
MSETFLHVRLLVSTEHDPMTAHVFTADIGRNQRSRRSGEIISEIENGRPNEPSLEEPKQKSGGKERMHISDPSLCQGDGSPNKDLACQPDWCAELL